MNRLRLGFAGPAEVPVLAALHAGCFEVPWDRAAMADVLAMPGTFALHATLGDAPVGFAIFRVVRDEGELLSIGVLPPFRRRGFGRRLLAAVLAEAERRGVASTLLEVAEDNPAAQALYRSTGFVAVGHRRAYYARATGAPAAAAVLRRGAGD